MHARVEAQPGGFEAIAAGPDRMVVADGKESAAVPKQHVTEVVRAAIDIALRAEATVRMIKKIKTETGPISRACCIEGSLK